MKIQINVRPNSKNLFVQKISENEYKIHLKKPALNGKANEELIDVLSNFFGVKKNSVKVIRGFTGKKKVVEVSFWFSVCRRQTP